MLIPVTWHVSGAPSGPTRRKFIGCPCGSDCPSSRCPSGQRTRTCPWTCRNWSRNVTATAATREHSITPRNRTRHCLGQSENGPNTISLRKDCESRQNRNVAEKKGRSRGEPPRKRGVGDFISKFDLFLGRQCRHCPRGSELPHLGANAH